MIKRWWQEHFGGHVNLGPVTAYGENAMHWAVNVRTRWWGYVCFRLPVRCFGRWWPLYLYASPNGTPWASTFCVGEGQDERRRAVLRRATFGHNFDTEKHREMLRAINGWEPEVKNG